MDIAATAVDLADATAGRTLDGVSLMPMLAEQPGYQRVLIQGGAENRAWAWRGVRSHRWTYTRHYTGEIELYSRRNDPYQLTNLAGSRPLVEARHAAWLQKLRTCEGDTCY